jgi:hypothetical protein
VAGDCDQLSLSSREEAATSMAENLDITGYAIVSDGDKIAGATG